jgi:hypothetical protein
LPVKILGYTQERSEVMEYSIPDVIDDLTEVSSQRREEGRRIMERWEDQPASPGDEHHNLTSGRHIVAHFHSEGDRARARHAVNNHAALLEALKRAEQWIKKQKNGFDIGVEGQDTLEQARQAIEEAS